MLSPVEDVINVINGVAWIVAAVGIALSVVFIVWSGYLFISSQGDPQGIARARMSLIGVVVGIVIIGGAFIFPTTISRYVIEPAGGIKIDPRVGADCDGLLRTQLVFQRNASTPERMQYVVNQIQAQNDECRPDLWYPVIKVHGTGFAHGCRDVDTSSPPQPIWHIGGVQVPETSLRDGSQLATNSTRDSDNNIMVYFIHPDDSSDENKGLPSNGAVCWMYVVAFSAWSEGYRPD